MSTGTNISWTDATWNPVSGCSRVSEGCDACYAVKQTYRLERMGQSKYAGLTVLNPKGERHFNGQVKCHDDALLIPLSWTKPRRVFVNSMSDLFHKSIPDAFIRKVFAAMSYAGQHTFQILTKRPERMAAWFADPENSLSACQAEWVVNGPDDKTPTGKRRIGRSGSDGAINGTRHGVGDGNYWPLPNVWLGTSIENNDVLERAIPLFQTPATVRFLSLEPLLGPIDLETVLVGNCGLLGWVITGGESGSKARPCNVAWMRSIAEHCAAARIPLFVKQDCGRMPGLQGRIPDDLWIKEFPPDGTPRSDASPRAEA